MARDPASRGDETPSPQSGDGVADTRQSRVGNVLRKAYDDTLAEPVPDIFADLLRKLG